MRLGLGGLAVLAILAVGLVVMGVKSRTARIGQDPDLQAKLETMQEELHTKEAALSIQEKRVKELEEASSEAAGGQKLTEEPQNTQANSETELTDESRGEFRESLKPNQRIASRNQALEEEAEGPRGTFQLHPGPKRSAPGPEQGLASSSVVSSPAAKQPAVNFDAQEVTATAKDAHKGKLSFRLVKDQPEVQFSGYLFVFVEMVDLKGDTRIYVYPKQAHLGEEDLPADYRQGETMAFYRNSKVELPYEDDRDDVRLGKVIILLYGDSGRIVFQRDFGRKELKMLSSKPSTPDSGVRSKAVEKRRAL